MVKSKFRHHIGGVPPSSHRKAFNRRSRFHDRLGKNQEVQPMDAQKMALNEILFTDRDNLGNVLRKHMQQDESRRWAKANVKIVSLGPGSFQGADQLSSIIDRLKRQSGGTVHKNNEETEIMGDVHQYNHNHQHNNSDAKQALASSSFEHDHYVMADCKSDAKQQPQPASLSPHQSDYKTLTSLPSPSVFPSSDFAPQQQLGSSGLSSGLSTSSKGLAQSRFSLSSSAPVFVPSPSSLGNATLSRPAPPPPLTSSSSPFGAHPSPQTHLISASPSATSSSSANSLAAMMSGSSHLQQTHLMDEKTASSSSMTLSVDVMSPSASKPHKPARRLLSLRKFSELKPASSNVNNAPTLASPTPSPASFIEPGCFVALDIDDTLLHTRHSPSFLLSDFGVRMFQQYTHKRFTEFAVKNQHCRRLQNALKDKVTVEPGTADVVRYLQDQGCWVFALTARFSEMAESTKRSLLSVGIDLTRTSPFPKQVIQDPETHSVCREGVIYCNSMDKGVILNRFLENVVFFSLIEQTNKQKMMMSSASPPTRSHLTPPGFIFVDDNAAHAHAILSNLKVCDTLSIPITCYHYTPYNDDQGSAWDMPQLGSLTSPTATAIPTMDTNLQHNSIVLQILQKQMQIFVDENKVLTNREAYLLLSSNNDLKADAQQQQQTDKHFFRP